MIYTGKTKNLGIIGYPIEHSLSPLMQNAAIKQAALDYNYIAMAVAPQDLSTAVQGLKSLRFRGFNVTIPHKITILPLLDEIDENAKMIGAVNTVVNSAGNLYGYNTDFIGFITALKNKNFVIKNKNAVLLGAGGAARAVVWGLIKEGIRSLTIGVRNPEKVKPLQDIFAAHLLIDVFEWTDKEFINRLQQTNLLVNTTPLGMAPHLDQMPPIDWKNIDKTTFVYDLIYTPETTLFLSQAKENGNMILNGEGMLVEQGAAAFKIWTGKSADTELMAIKLQQSLQR